MQKEKGKLVSCVLTSTRERTEAVHPLSVCLSLSLYLSLYLSTLSISLSIAYSRNPLSSSAFFSFAAMEQQRHSLEGSSRHSWTFVLQPPTVSAVYPNFAIVVWYTPQTAGSSVSRSPSPSTTSNAGLSTSSQTPAPSTSGLVGRIVWRYTTEWNCECLAECEPVSVTSGSTHIVLPTPHTGETYHLRVVARGTLGGDTVALTSARASLLARCTVPMPWMAKEALYHPCLFEALLLAVNSTDPLAAVPAHHPLRERLTMRTTEPQSLESGVSVHVVRRDYQQRLCPFTTPVVHFFVVRGHGQRSRRGGQGCWPYAALLEEMKQDEASVVFCGVGELGHLAVLAAHRLLQAVQGQCPEVVHRVLCLAYGTARRCLQDDPALLRTTAHATGNFLFYTGDLHTADGGSGFANSAVFASGGPKPPPASKEVDRVGAFLNVPLGVRVGPLLDLHSGGHVLQAVISTMATVTEAERMECLEANEHLQLLEQLQRVHQGRHGAQGVAATASHPPLLSPTVESTTCTLEEHGEVVLTLHGSSLHYCPALTCVMVCEDDPNDPVHPVLPTLKTVQPHTLSAGVSLLPCLWNACTTLSCGGERGRHGGRAPALPQTIPLEALLHTSMGVTAPFSVPVDVPGDVMELLALASSSSGDERGVAWLTAAPDALLEAALQLEPFLATQSAHPSRAEQRQFIPTVSCTLLGMLASAAELRAAYTTKRSTPHSSGLLAFVANVAARVTAPRPGSASTTVPTLRMPALREADYLAATLREFALATKADAAAYTSRTASWKRRVLASLPWLQGAAYVAEVRWLLMVLPGPEVSDAGGVVFQETQLYARVVQYLRDVCGVSVSFPRRVCEAIPFEAFYELVYPLFLPSAGSTAQVEHEVVTGVVSMWVACVVYELRCAYCFAHYVAVIGCRGSGCSTVASAVEGLCAEHSLRYIHTARSRQFVVRTVPEGEYHRLRHLLRLGLSVTVLVVGEVDDIAQDALKAMIRRARADVAAADHALFRRRAQLLLSKADEHLDFAELAEETPEEVSCLSEAVLQSISARARDGCGDDLMAISLAPSEHCVRASHFSETVDVEQFTAALQQTSLRLLWDVLKADAELGHCQEA